jgi:subtilisin family serine protease
MSSHPRRGPSAAGLALTLCVLAGSASAADAPSAAHRSSIQWSNGLVDRVDPMAQAQVRQTLAQLASRPDARRVRVTLDQPPTPAQRVALEQAGLDLLTPLGGTTYFASLASDANPAAIAGVGVTTLGAIDPTRKMHADILGGQIRAWTIVGPTPEVLRAKHESGVITLGELRRAEADPLVAAVVMLHRDADLGAEADRLTARFGLRVESRIPPINSLVVHAPASLLRSLASEDAVMWIEPPLPALRELNAENRALTGVDTVNESIYQLDGSGVTVMVYDGGKVATHPDLAGRLTVGPTDTSFNSGHATHVAGTIAGSGSVNPTHRGMAPGAHIVSYGLEQAGGLSQGFLYTDPCDVFEDYSAAIALGADLSNNSIGTNTEPNGYPCEWQGNYGVTCALIDSIARGSLGDPFRIVWAAGNERQGSRCDVEGFGDFFSTAPPAGAKNHMAIGSVDADTDLSSSFSSWGPVDDGRLKPDFSAPGCQAGGDGGVTSLNTSGGYTTMCGTSMASPTVAGIVALMLEEWRLSFPEAADPRNATLKAILANTAEDRGNAGPDYKYGYGSVRAVPAVDTILGENVIEAEVGQGGVHRFVVIIDPEDTELRVTIAWDDAPGTPNVNPVLVNDLDLRVIDPNGDTHYPWTLNPAAPDSPAVRTGRDGVNNIEQVWIENPVPGGYTVEVVGFNVADGPSQPFGAASNGFLVNCSSAGIASFGAGVIPCNGSTGVQVIDCDLNTSDTVIDTVQVTVASDSQPGGVVLTLTETAPESAAFLADFTYSSGPGADLLVAPGDAVTVTYFDADDGAGGSAIVTRTISVDCTPPVVTGATATNIQPRGATIEIQTDEPTAVTIAYGTSMAALNGTAASGSPRSGHSIAITGLQDATDYVFVVTSAVDGAGNASSDNNNGAGFAFTTPDIPDFFTEQFTSGIDLNGKRILFTPNGQFDFYTACLEDLDNAYHTNPAGGQSIPSSDDQHFAYTLTGGASVSLYGQSYSGVFISPNGYITLGSGSNVYSESLADHFSLPRVAGAFDDLNPNSGGFVSYRQLADRLAVTWQGVPQYNNSDSNNFQIELFYDGTIAISHLSVTTGDAIVGLSEGVGLSPDYLASDLSAYAGCNDCPADLAEPSGVLNFFDLAAYLDAYNAGSPQADWAAPSGVLNFFDLAAYLDAYNAGCP